MHLGQKSVNMLRSTWLATAAVGLLTVSTAVQAQPAQPLRNVVQLSASGSVEVEQDWLQMNLAVVREGSEAAAVQQQLQQVLEAAMRKLKPQEVEQALQVRSGSFGIYPRQNKDGKIQGWQGRAEIVLEGTDFDRISKAAAQVPQMTLSGMGFHLSDQGRQKVMEQAQREAIDQFKQQAQFVSEQFGFAGYSLREVSVNSQGGFYAPRMQKANMLMAASEQMDAAAVPVEAGKEQVTVQVSGSVQMQ